MLCLKHLTQILCIIVFLHPKNRKTSPWRTRLILRVCLGIFSFLYVVSTIVFTVICIINFEDWDLFQAKEEIIQFNEGKYLDEVTFHWFEIELSSIPVLLAYYVIAYHFFLLHRQNKKNIAKGVESDLSCKPKNIGDRFKKKEVTPVKRKKYFYEK